LFNANDDPLLHYLRDDNLRIEPEWYIPIIPMVLVNGAEGIGTGWSTKIPNYDVREIIKNIKRMLDGEQPLPMVSFLISTSNNIVETLEDSEHCHILGKI
jgi:DNA gyrase/topoisomerase IV, subunit A